MWVDARFSKWYTALQTMGQGVDGGAGLVGDAGELGREPAQRWGWMT